MASKQAFFSSVRTTPEFKISVDETLSSLGLSWGTFVNNAAKQLVTERRVVFEARDSAGFTAAKGAELQNALAEIRAGKNITKPMTGKVAQKHLKNLATA